MNAENVPRAHLWGIVVALRRHEILNPIWMTPQNAHDIAHHSHAIRVNKVLGLACLFMDILVEGESPLPACPVENRQTFYQEP